MYHSVMLITHFTESMYYSVMLHNSPLSYASELTRVNSPVENKQITAVNNTNQCEWKHRTPSTRDTSNTCINNMLFMYLGVDTQKLTCTAVGDRKSVACQNRQLNNMPSTPKCTPTPNAL